jgi:type VI secretion system secreted protein Hcp
MAVDVFLKIKGVDGESKDSKHVNEIDVLSYSWGISQTGTMAYGGGGGAGKANFSDFSFMKRLDKASALLELSCATGKHFDDAKLTVRKAGDKPQEYYKVNFYDLLVSSYQLSGSSEEPMESVSINYSKIEIEYAQQDAKGELGGPVFFKYDLKENKAY